MRGPSVMIIKTQILSSNCRSSTGKHVSLFNILLGLAASDSYFAGRCYPYQMVPIAVESSVLQHGLVVRHCHDANPLQQNPLKP